MSYDEVDMMLAEADRIDYRSLMKRKGMSYDSTDYETSYNPRDNRTVYIGGIPVTGNDRFIQLISEANEVLQARASEDWRFIKRLVGSIDLVPDDGSGALGRIYHGCSVVEFLPTTLNYSHITVAQKLAHEAYHLAGNYGIEGEIGAHRYETEVAAKIGGVGFSEEGINSRISYYLDEGRFQ